MKQKIYAIIDFETYSEVDLKLVGAYEYSMHPTTEILCASWTWGTRRGLQNAEIKGTWSPRWDLDSDTTGKSDFSGFYDLIMDTNFTLVAHNAYFEQCILRNVFARKYMYSKRAEILEATPPSRFICSAAMASACAFPRSLDGVSQALKLEVTKDLIGNALIKKWCKPRTPSKTDPRTRHDDEREFSRIVEYCESDILVTAEVFCRLPLLSDFEQKIWELDQRINFRGFSVDRPLVDTVLKLIDVESKALDAETNRLTMGLVESARQPIPLREFLKDEGLFLPDMTKLTIEDALKSGEGTPTGRRLLALRQASSKSSTAKYEAFSLRSATDGRLRDNLVYHASTTGRWGGSGVQPQNLPRPTIKDGLEACDDIRSGVASEGLLATLETLRMLYGDPMEVFSSIIRNMIIAPTGEIFDIADYNAIEARVLMWLVGDTKALENYAKGVDQYRVTAASIFNRSPDSIEKDSFERFTGKETFLGSGYGMGWAKLHLTCNSKGIKLSEDLSKRAIDAYRRDHPKVVRFWKDIELAAISAVEHPGSLSEVLGLKLYYDRKTLWCQLFSGRKIAFQSPSVRYDMNQWGHKNPTLYHYSTNPITRKWENGKTWGGVLTNNVIQGIARDIMAAAIYRIEKTKTRKVVLSVHDELIATRKIIKGGSIKEFIKLMEELPEWAKGCPIKVEGFSSTRYRK